MKTTSLAIFASYVCFVQGRSTCTTPTNTTVVTNITQKPNETVENKELLKKSYIYRCEGSSVHSVCCSSCKPSAAPPHPSSGCCGLDTFVGKPNPQENPVTNIRQYPWMVVIEYKMKKTYQIKPLCQGVLISSKYVLTTAHCVQGPILDIAIMQGAVFGEYDQSNEGPDCVGVGREQECTDGALRVPIEKSIPHKDFYKRLNDIALLRLRDYVPYTPFIRPICLPSEDLTEDDQPIFYAAGWGKTEVASSSNVKLQVDLPFVPLKECQSKYGEMVELWNKQICAGGEADKDTCKGDSGGPLMFYNGRVYELAGIISFGLVLCGGGTPGVYTKVYAYLPWIRSHLKP